MTSRFALAAAFAFAVGAFTPRADARPLRPPTPAELAPAMRLLERGSVAIVESDSRGWLQQVSIASIYGAPRSRVFETVTNVARYPEFLQNFKEVEVLQRRDRLIAYEWLWRGVLFDFRGSNMMTLTPETRIDVRTVSGDLGDGRFLVDLSDLPGGRTLAISTLFTDPRRGNWLARTLVARNPSMLHSMNLSVGMVFAYGMKARVESRGPVRRGGGGGALRGFSDVDLRSLAPLLARGEIAVVETNGTGALRQTAVLSKMRASPDRVRTVVADPARYPDYISNIESCDVVERSGGRLVYDLEIDSPVLDIDGRMELQPQTDGSLRVRCTEGDLAGAKWGWEFRDLGSGHSGAVHYGYTDMARANWILRRLIQREPYFEHGLNVGSELLMIRAIRGRAEGTGRATP